MQQIVIEGDIARVVETTTLHQAPLEDLLPKLERRIPTILPMLPDGTRFAYYDPDSKKGHFLIERKPTRQTINVKLTREDVLPEIDRQRADDDEWCAFNLQFPYAYFSFPFEFTLDGQRMTDFVLENGSLYWSPTALENTDSKLWYARMPNIMGSGRICWGAVRNETATLRRRLDDKVKTWYATAFNDHLDATATRPEHLDSLTAWEEESNDPLAFTNWPMFRTGGHTVETILRITPDDPAIVAAQINDALHVVPVPPADFTIGRMRTWYAELDEYARNRLQRAIALVDATPEPTDA